MSHTAIHEDHSAEVRKEVTKVTIILSVLTVIELALGFYMMGIEAASTRLLIKGTIVILMLAKAFYIVAYFMHLKHEVKNLIMTVCVPLCIFFWFITTFLIDGNSFRNLRNTYDPHYKAQSSIKAEPKEVKHEEKEEKKEKKEGLQLDEPRTTY
jgi:cytochrome c oxidase subunit IV